MDTIIEIDQLQKADVLLCRGGHLLGDIIVRLDGGTYSHGVLYKGKDENGDGYVIHAVPRGVVDEPICTSFLLNEQEFIDVFRYKKTTGEVGLAPEEADCIVKCATRFVGDKYAYDHLLLFGLLAITRDITAYCRWPWEQKVIRVLLDHATDLIFQLIDRGQELLVCTEAVYRFYTESDVPGPFALTIEGVLFPKIKPMEQGAISRGSVDPELDAACKRFSAALLQLKTSRNTNPSGAGWDPVVASCVSPHDLETSPNLQRIGRLSPLPKKRTS